jgi:hypothetical protein
VIRIRMNVDKLVERMQAARAKLPREIDKELDALAWEAVEDLKRTDSFEDRSGTLRRRFTFVQPGQYRRRIVAGDPAVPYAKFLERGTRSSAASWRAQLAIGLRRAVGFSVDKSLRKQAGSWRIRPRRFFEHARSVVRRRLKAAMLRAVGNALRK